MAKSEVRKLFAVLLLAVLTGVGAWLLRMKVAGVDPTIEGILAIYEPNCEYKGLEILYPNNETLFPAEIPAPTFHWRDPSTRAWFVEVSLGSAEPVRAICSKPQWSASPDVWERIKKESLDRNATVTILGVTRTRQSRILRGSHLTFRTSRDPVGAPIFYREVNLPFIEAVKDPSLIRWRFGPVSAEQAPPVILTGLPVCGNCHSFSANGSLLGMDVDYSNDKGSYAIADVNEEMTLTSESIITWSDYKRDEGEETFGLLSQVSPDGRYVVSTVKDKSVFVPKDDLTFSQLFFPFQGILCVYDRQTDIFASLPGADDPNYVQSNANWSPDGRYIVFARSKAYKLKKAVTEGKVLLSPEDCKEFLDEGKTFLFDLYRVEFNAGKGGIAEPLAGASNNGKSNFFPRYSPDGKWIVFCQAASYMLLQPDSNLYIMPAEGGEPRLLACNTDRMNSWHSWSPNSRWLVFSSKVNTPYTQLFLTHIDEQGLSSPAVLLERFTASDRAANIPEFVNVSPTAIRQIHEQFLDDYSYVRAARELLRADDYEAAAEALAKAFSINPDNPEAHFHRAQICEHRGDTSQSIAELTEVLRLDPNHLDAHYNLGVAKLRMDKLDEAREHLEYVVKRDPNHIEAHANLGSLWLVRGELESAVEQLNQTVQLDPNYVDAWYNLGQAMLQCRQPAKAVACWLKVVSIRPNDAQAHYNLALLLAMESKLEPATEHYEQAVKLNSQIDKSPDLPQIIAQKFAEERTFPKAAEYEARALKIAEGIGDKAFIEASKERLKTYKQLSASTTSGQ